MIFPMISDDFSDDLGIKHGDIIPIEYNRCMDMGGFPSIGGRKSWEKTSATGDDQYHNSSTAFGTNVLRSYVSGIKCIGDHVACSQCR